MEKYRIVMREKGGLRIGLNSYTKAEAEERLLKMQAVGHKNVEIMSEAECFKGE